MSNEPNRATPSALCLQILSAYLTPEQRNALAACNAMRDQILAAARTREEVLPVKLAWWQEEINRLAAGQARHPLTQQVAAALDINAAAIELINEWLIAAQRDALGTQIDSPTALRIDAFRRYGASLLLALGVDGDSRASALPVGHCALAIMALDHTSPDEIPIDCNDMLAASIDELAAIENTDSALPVNVLAHLLRHSLKDLQNNQKTGPLRLALTGWRAARQWRKRNPT